MGFAELIAWFITAELLTIRQEARRSQKWLGNEIGKHENTIGYWERGERLPDPGNISLICKKLGVSRERADFLEHVIGQLYQGPGIVSDLDKRNLFIVESAERSYGYVFKWDPLLLPSMVQTEAYHMNVLPRPREGAALKIKHWKRKEIRQDVFFGRNDAPTARILVPAVALADLERLASEEREGQIRRLLEVDALPNCEIRVVEGPHLAPHAFDIFRPSGRAGSGPAFVYVETIDQSRHIVEPEKLTLYDQISSIVWDVAIPIGRFFDGRVHQLAEEFKEQQHR